MNAQGINRGPGVSWGRRLYIYPRLSTWLRRKLSGKEAHDGCHCGCQLTEWPVGTCKAAHEELPGNHGKGRHFTTEARSPAKFK